MPFQLPVSEGNWDNRPRRQDLIPGPPEC